MKLQNIIDAFLCDSNCRKSIRQADIVKAVYLLVNSNLTQPRTLKKIKKKIDALCDYEFTKV